MERRTEAVEILLAVGDISLWESIQLWFAGESLSGYSMAGISFLWWERFGKVASIVGGLVVILDYVGEERLRAWGAKLQDKPLRKLLRWIKNGVLPGALALIGIVVVSFPVERAIGPWIASFTEPIAAWIDSHLDLWWIVPWFAAMWAAVAAEERLEKRDNSKLLLPLRGAIAVLGLAFVVVLVAANAADLLVYGVTWLIVAGSLFVAAVLADILILPLDPLVVRPIAWALGRETPGQPIRWAGFTLLLLGQLLDLLAS